jgi:hypothetical protein
MEQVKTVRNSEIEVLKSVVKKMKDELKRYIEEEKRVKIAEAKGKLISVIEM